MRVFESVMYTCVCVMWYVSVYVWDVFMHAGMRASVSFFLHLVQNSHMSHCSSRSHLTILVCQDDMAAGTLLMPRSC